ncbi:MAG TPA: HAD family hydrolase, partial [Nitrososphaera sp.]|nr:HAD family hydrolase [Nitrososphaera sp.]
ALSKYCEMGIIANQSEDICELLEESGLDRFFKVKVISSLVKLKKPDLAIFDLALREAGRQPHECIMVGDRLDTDICPANTIGMTTIRTTNSLFSLQTPSKECEKATFTVARLSQIPPIVERIISC